METLSNHLDALNGLLNDFFETMSGYLWGWPMIILLLGTHIFLTIRLGVPQRKLLTAIRLSLSKDKDSTGDVSQFGALATALAATIGTGNIVGVATAVALGGPGAVLWCWLSGVFGMATKYSEGLLSIKYRVKAEDGRMLGGPMYALERGLGWKWLAVLFALFTALASFGIGNTVQANAISTIAQNSYGIPTWLSGGLVCIFAALVLLGGIKSIARVCSALVPFMAFFYVLGCIYILIANGQYVWPAIKLICESAFTPQAAGGGFIGTTVIVAARMGIARGLFSNESGLGSAPIVAAAAQTRNPVRQALVSSTGTFWDTVVICAFTGLVIVSSIIAHPDISVTDGAALTKAAFSKIPYIGTPLLSFGLLTFAFTTILGWCYYGERAVEYLKGKRWMLAYRIVFVAMVFVGSIISLDVVWNAADCMNALMAIPNLIALLLLSNVIAKETRHYLYGNRLDHHAPSE
ncbi:MAG: alanine:cation symporter family protein [Muribaculaceae bacterium]|nr:alanine:cation symporter family protein [Muribaculaceae bacterium]